MSECKIYSFFYFKLCILFHDIYIQSDTKYKETSNKVFECDFFFIHKQCLDQKYVYVYLKNSQSREYNFLRMAD